MRSDALVAWRVQLIATARFCRRRSRWRRAGLPAPCPRAPRSPPGKADRIIVVKSERTLVPGARRRGPATATGWRSGAQPKGTKIYQGDGRTPEGSYTHRGVQRRTASSTAPCGCPTRTSTTARVARALGQAAGGDIMIHGLAPERRELRRRALAVQLDQRLHRRHRRGDRRDLAAGGDRDADRDPAMIPTGATAKPSCPERSERGRGRRQPRRVGSDDLLRMWFRTCGQGENR